MFPNNAGSCGGVFKEQRGHLSSPSFPNHYEKDKTCIYEISQLENTYIKLEILQFNLTYETTCNDDFIEIRDGYTEESPLIGKFCGDKNPAFIQSTQNQIRIR